jgi:glycosyltransferase involved in cell wall biosynthesis
MPDHPDEGKERKDMADISEKDRHPLVSICIPTYNRAGMIGDAIQSALSQTYPSLEVVVVDNASTDHTAEVVGSFHDLRLRFVRNDRNLGLFGNFNRCIELAKGSLIHILHSDDAIPPTFTETCVKVFLAHPEVAMTFTPARVRGEEAVPGIAPTMDRIYPPPEGFRAILLDRGLVSCPSVMVRREVYSDVGTFSLEYPYSSDTYQWLRISLRRAMALVGGTYILYRQGAHTESYRLLFESPVGYVDTVRIYARIICELGSERAIFTPDLNIAITRFVKDCLYAMCTRRRQMQGYRPSFLAGVAHSGWDLIRPLTFTEGIRNAWLLLAILVAPVLCVVPGLGRAILALRGRGEISY